MDKETKDELREVAWDLIKLGAKYAGICFVVYFILGFLEGLIIEASKIEIEEDTSCEN